MKTIRFLTFGCKVNQYETQRIREDFRRLGFIEDEKRKNADLYLINTCTVTHRADADSLRVIRKIGVAHPKAKIIVTGCLTELDEDKIKQAARVDLIVKNKDKDRLVSLCSSFFNVRRTQNAERRTESSISYFKDHTRAFLKIQDGCNNFCSYCKIPLVRGRSCSRPAGQILREARRLAESGYKEIVLTGICLGAYGKDLKPRQTLVDLIKNIEKIGGILRIRLSSIEAGDVSDELIRGIKESAKLCRHLHIPLQSGDDRILKKMNRGYSAKVYLDLIRKIRSQIPRIAITTDCLVGFPGEDEAGFRNTLKIIKQIRPLRTHVFPYSARRGTRAFEMKGRIPDKLAKERAGILKKTADACSMDYKKDFLGQKMDVLIESRDKKDRLYWSGHTDNYLQVLVKSRSNLKNRLVLLQLHKLSGENILGKLSY